MFFSAIHPFLSLLLLTELQKLYPPEYDRASGSLVSAAWADRDIPVPPAWVKDWVHLPRGTEAATLAKELEGSYPPNHRDVLVSYVKEWLDVSQWGYGMVIYGPSTTYQRRRWYAAATINEIAMRFAAITVGFTQEWVNVGMLRTITAAKKDRYDFFAAQKGRLFKAKLLYVEDPLQMESDAEERWLLQDIYDERAARKLPTITSIHANISEGFGHVKNVLGPTIAAVMETETKYYVEVR